MADPTDQDKASKEPNLELPSLSLRRKKKGKPPKGTPAEDAAEPGSEASDAASVTPPAPATSAPATPSPKRAERPESPATPPARAPLHAAAPPAPPAPSPAPDTAAPAAAPLDETPAERAPEPFEAKAALESSAGDTAPKPARKRRPSRARAGWTATLAALERFDDRVDALAFKKIPGHLAAIITGIVCGIVSVLLSWLAASGCDAVRGVGTCGSFGVVALVAIIAIEVLVGGILLRAWGVNDPVSTALLGVGLVAVFVMLFLLPSVGSIWMVLVIPLLTALMFLLSWWVTAKIVETDD